jgi:diaminopimelate epimerase
MKIHFFKYQATGNDFVMIDNRSGAIQLSEKQVRSICDRRLGVGADGLMLLEKHPKENFNLVYYNSDGSQSLCGNGSRAAVQLASSLGMINGKATFHAYDGPHQGELLPAGIIKIKMSDVSEAKQVGSDFFFHTGSPHLIRFVDQVEEYPVVEEGRKIRYSEEFKPAGTNVNFVDLRGNNTIYVRTYERGVENETLSCGTGVTAAALAASFQGYSSPVQIKTKGGDLSVEFKASHSGQVKEGGSSLFHSFRDIFLTGPAKMVFEGDLEL